MRGFCEAAIMSASPTHTDIEIYLEMRLDGSTDPNVMTILFHSDYGIW